MRKFLIMIPLIFVVAASFKAHESTEYIQANTEFSSNVILIPLDSRPACGDFVVDAGKIAGIKIMTPPSKLLDYLTIPGEVENIRKWLFMEAPKADAIIISIDQLLKGGLIASREGSLSDEEIDNLIEYLIELHKLIPNTPIYAFNILPRTQPQSSIDNYQQRRALMAYSHLIGCEHAGLPVDDEALLETINEVTPENLNSYLNRFEQCEKLSKRLIKLVPLQNKILDKLKQFKYYSLHTDKIFFIHGADEIALTLLAELIQHNERHLLKVCVKYNQKETSTMMLPFMAVPIKTIVKEKCRQFQCEMVESPENADFTLYISVNDNSVDNLAEFKLKNAEYISHFIEQGKSIALVDLGIHFDKEETLLPVLIDYAVPINSLLAYSGWNTASNAIGIALSQAIIAKNSNNVIENLTFLNQRFLEDQFYLKDVIDTVNHALKKSGSYDNSYLDYGTELEFATFVMRTAMNKRIADYKCSRAFKAPVKIGTKEVNIKDFGVSMSYPWPRTFEVRLKINNLTLSQVK